MVQSSRSLHASALLTRLVLPVLFSIASPPAAGAQVTAPRSITGIVLDEAGSIIQTARLTLVDRTGAIRGTDVTDVTGAFAIHGLVPGDYTLAVEADLFSPFTHLVRVGPTGSVPALRIVLTPAGFTETVVVTAHRSERRIAEIPQRIDVVDRTDLERTVAADLTDALKKNAGVDVVQYTGVLSGIGIRGFRPQFSGINKRSLLLIDGRPSGITNLATLRLDNVDRIEVLKGPASAVYGSSAMGGVVNVITRRSRGTFNGDGRASAASFGGSEFSGRLGGSLGSRVDFDASGNAFNQRDDLRMGNGEVRPATSYATYDSYVRIGVDVGHRWRVDGRLSGYVGRDIMTPGDLASGINAQGSKDVEHAGQDVRLFGRVRSHALSFTAFHATEGSHTTNVTSANPLDQPYLPYLSFESELSWAGVQANDNWTWSRVGRLVAGVDVEAVSSVSRSFARTGDPVAPFSADSNKRTFGVYAENTFRWRSGGTVVTLGGRIDRITTETVPTPFKTNFSPSDTTFSVFSPSAGLTHQLAPGLRAHVAAGRAFIPAEAIMLTGFTTTTVAGRTQISQGNPDLRPERSTSFDVGLEWTNSATRIDVTSFRTVVTDRFISNVVISNPPAPEPIVLSVVNGLDAHIGGLDAELERRLGAGVGAFVNLTHYFERKETLPSGAEQDILNVARTTVRAGVDLDFGRLSARVSGRFVQGRKDNNFNLPGFPIVDYDDFTVVDVSATYQLAGRHFVLIGVNNLFDAFYYEKLGFPLQGVSFKASYRFGF